MRLNSRPVIVLATVVGILLIAVAIYYWVEPAKSLASFMPGHEAGSNHHHFKHGLAAFLVGVALLVFVWFQSAPGRDVTAD